MDSKVSKKIRKKRIAWVIPHPGKGSGGHRTIIQNINALVEAGYDLSKHGGIDGNFGSYTRKCVKDFQSSAKIGVDGKVGPQTRKAFLND